MYTLSKFKCYFVQVQQCTSILCSCVWCAKLCGFKYYSNAGMIINYNKPTVTIICQWKIYWVTLTHPLTLIRAREWSEPFHILRVLDCYLGVNLTLILSCYSGVMILGSNFGNIILLQVGVIHCHQGLVIHFFVHYMLDSIMWHMNCKFLYYYSINFVFTNQLSSW